MHRVRLSSNLYSVRKTDFNYLFKSFRFREFYIWSSPNHSASKRPVERSFCADTSCVRRGRFDHAVFCYIVLAVTFFKSIPHVCRCYATSRPTRWTRRVYFECRAPRRESMLYSRNLRQTTTQPLTAFLSKESSNPVMSALC